jgi:uncharacterized glyoxalase superfamily protein PhnB
MSQSAANPKTSIAPMLSVRRGAKAVEFYKAAFGAGELFRIDDESGAVVARLSVGEEQKFQPRDSRRRYGPDGDDRGRS